MDKISIIIPVYNVENYIEECLKSVLNQTYSNLEILCIDDCGTDNSVEIINRFAASDNRIKIIKHEVNKGLPQARNTGLENCEGKYIFFLDSDDYIKEDAIEKMYNSIVETNADVVISNYESFYETNSKEFIKKAEKSKYTKNEPELLITSIDNWEKIFMDMPCVSWGKLFKTEFLKQNNILFIKEKAMYEDNGFILKVLSQMPKIYFLPEISVMYRIRENSITSKFDNKKYKKKKRSDLRKVLDDAFNYIKENTSREVYSKLYKIIKNTDLHKRYFEKWYDCLLKIRLGKFNKVIKVFNIPILREKYCIDYTVLKILGIKIKKRMV